MFFNISSFSSNPEVSMKYTLLLQEIKKKSVFEDEDESRTLQKYFSVIKFTKELFPTPVIPKTTTNFEKKMYTSFHTSLY